jgi:bloom syndrome protein
MYGQGKKYQRSDIERLFRQLVVDTILDEELHITAADHTVCYVKLGRRANELLMGRLQFKFQTRSGKNKVAESHSKTDTKSPRAQMEMDCYTELLVLAKAIGKVYEVFDDYIKQNWLIIFTECLFL